MYFLVIAEILALALRNNEDIEGISIREIKHLLNQFADDMDICSILSQKSITAIFQELEIFRLQSGFTVSYDKTTMYRIGSLRHSSARMYDMDQVRWSNEDINVLGIIVSHEDILQKNYNAVLDKSKRVINQWFNRDLTLLGKVQVVNALIASLYVYPMMVLPLLPQTFVKRIDNMVREYLWKGKKAKIALKILQLPKEEGGLNLVNFELKDRALKATWPQILYREPEYASIVYTIMRCSVLGVDIWRCSLAPEDVKYLGIKNQFWKDVLVLWCSYNYYYQTREENQLLWYNSKVRVKGKPFMWNHSYKKGLVFIHQVFDGDGYKPYQEVQQQFGLTILEYNCIKSAIPIEYKRYFERKHPGQFSPLPPHTYDRAISYMGKGLSRVVYRFLSQDVILIHNKYIKWRSELGPDFCQDICSFGKIHRDIFRVTNIPKYRSFQYRLLQRALVTNIQLKAWGVLQTDQCTFCGKESETVLHLLVECGEVEGIWRDFGNYIVQEYGVVTQLSPVDIVLNQIVKTNHVVSFLCLIVKQYLYSTRCLKQKLSFGVLKSKMSQIQAIEKYIATKNDRLSVHNKKWLVRPRVDDQSLSQYVQERIDKMSVH